MSGKLTAGEVMESLTGFEEIAVARAFDKEILTLAEHHPLTFTRALVFVLTRRGGMSDVDAKEHVLGMTVRDVQGQFAEEDPEVMPEEPETESGKDGLSSNGQPMSLPVSVS